MEGSIRKSTKLVGFAGALLALSLMAGCGPNQNVVDAQAAAQQADQAASRAEAASQQAQQAAASAQASASKVEQSAADAKAAADPPKRLRQRPIPVAAVAPFTIIGIATCIIMLQPRCLQLRPIAAQRRLLPRLNREAKLTVAKRASSCRMPFFFGLSAPAFSTD